MKIKRKHLPPDHQDYAKMCRGISSVVFGIRSNLTADMIPLFKLRQQIIKHGKII